MNNGCIHTSHTIEHFVGKHSTNFDKNRIILWVQRAVFKCFFFLSFFSLNYRRWPLVSHTSASIFQSFYLVRLVFQSLLLLYKHSTYALYYEHFHSFWFLHYENSDKKANTCIDTYSFPEWCVCVCATFPCASTVKMSKKVCFLSVSFFLRV